MFCKKIHILYKRKGGGRDTHTGRIQRQRLQRQRTTTTTTMAPDTAPARPHINYYRNGI